MTIFERLAAAMETAQAEQDLPDFLAREISVILQNRRDFVGREDELDDLVEKVTLYDTYGQTGYLGMGVNSIILEKALKKLMQKEQA